MVVWLGIDPGIAGALATYAPDTGEAEVVDMPTIKKRSGRNGVDAHAINDMFSMWGNYRVVCVLEQVASRPNDGKASAFQFGEGFGIVRACLACHGIPYHLITPPQWKKFYGIKNDKTLTAKANKLKSVGHAKQLFPSLTSDLVDSKDGRAEALLLANYGVQNIKT